MKITVLKSTVESALAPILKMVSCSKAPNDFHPTLTFKSDRHSVWLRCALMDNLLESAMPDAVCDDKNASFDVNLETFKEMVAKPTGTRLSIEQDSPPFLCSKSPKISHGVTLWGLCTFVSLVLLQN